MSSTSECRNPLLMREVRGEWSEWLEQITTLYNREEQKRMKLDSPEETPWTPRNQIGDIGAVRQRCCLIINELQFSHFL